ncbi:ATP-binding cassette domain-containing protein, partial [Acinetobacter ursingii]
LNGLESIDTGSILIHQQNIAELNHAELIKTRQKIGMIFQHFNLMSAKTVWENVALPLRIAGYDKAEIEQRVSEVLTLVELEAKRHDYP